MELAQLRRVLRRDDQRHNEAVEAEGGAETPDEDHANVQLWLAARVLHAAVATHSNREAGGEVAQADRKAGAKVGVGGVERVGRLAGARRQAHAGGDDDGDDEAEDAADAREDDRHDRLHDHLCLHLVPGQLGDGREAQCGLPRAVRGAHVSENERERRAEEAEEGRVLGAVRRGHHGGEVCCDGGGDTVLSRQRPRRNNEKERGAATGVAA